MLNLAFMYPFNDKQIIHFSAEQHITVFSYITVQLMNNNYRVLREKKERLEKQGEKEEWVHMEKVDRGEPRERKEI